MQDENRENRTEPQEVVSWYVRPEGQEVVDCYVPVSYTHLTLPTSDLV